MIPATPYLGISQVVLLLLLLTGHVLGDFLFQTRSMVERKSERKVLLLHIGSVLVAHTILVLPFVHWDLRSLILTLVLLFFLGGSHALIDAAKIRLTARRGDSMALFMLDQACHGFAILGVWGLWCAWLGDKPGVFAPTNLAILSSLALIANAYVLNGNAGAALIKLFLDPLQPAGGTTEGSDSRTQSIQQMGRSIGILERMLLVSLIMLGQWEAIAWIFAAKTLARFKELDKKDFSEYYLIGTLASLLFAAATGSVVRWLLIGTL